MSSGFRPIKVESNEWFLIENPDGTEYLFPSKEQEDYINLNIPFTGNLFIGFKEAIGFKESQGKYKTINSLGYLGKYQFGIETLKTIGIKDKTSFLKSPKIQERAFVAFLAKNKWEHFFNFVESLKNEENYCPICGQKNTDLNISFKELTKDFASDYFTFDSKFFKTLWPLITKPGKVPKEFIEGKRLKYIAPLRGFLFLSFISFFLWGLSINIDPLVKSSDEAALLPDSLKNYPLPAEGFIDSISPHSFLVGMKILSEVDGLSIGKGGETAAALHLMG